MGGLFYMHKHGAVCTTTSRWVSGATDQGWCTPRASSYNLLLLSFKKISHDFLGHFNSLLSFFLWIGSWDLVVRRLAYFYQFPVSSLDWSFQHVAITSRDTYPLALPDHSSSLNRTFPSLRITPFVSCYLPYHINGLVYVKSLQQAVHNILLIWHLFSPQVQHCIVCESWTMIRLAT